MIIKEVYAKSVKDSRKESTIQIIIKISEKEFKTSAPAGKSVGKYEVKPYAISLEKDIEFINDLDVKEINELNLENFKDLEKIEKLVSGKIGGNSLYVLEASLLKALAYENKKSLWEFLNPDFISMKGDRERFVLPRPVGNAIGGGLHSQGNRVIKPDFQEFLFIPNCKTFKKSIEINEKAHKLTRRFLGLFKFRKNDEGAWETELSNEEILDIMKKVQKIIKEKYGEEIDIGIDAAASSFYQKSSLNKERNYVYKNPANELKKHEQINYIFKLIEKYRLFYVEDPFEENDFVSFRELTSKVSWNKVHNSLIVGDDLVATNPKRLTEAIKKRAVNAIIIKPNQIGSLLKLKKVIDIAKKNNIATIMSHRSGETNDYTIADLAVGFECDFIKTGICGRVRKMKLNRLAEIERQIRRNNN